MADEKNKNTSAANNGGEGMSVDDIFNQLGDIFGDIYGSTKDGAKSAPKNSRRGKSLRLRLLLTEKELAAGVTKTIRFYRNEVCMLCGGSGALDNGSVVNCSTCGGTGKAAKSMENTMFGATQVMEECPKCKGTGLFIINPCTLCDGSGVTRDEVEETIQVPAGVAAGSCLTVKGKGHAGENGGATGDLLVVIELKK